MELRNFKIKIFYFLFLFGSHSQPLLILFKPEPGSDIGPITILVGVRAPALPLSFQVRLYFKELRNNVFRALDWNIGKAKLD